jgi:hypothetical protein
MESSVLYQPASEEDFESTRHQEPSRAVQEAREKPGISLVMAASAELETYAYRDDPYDAPGVNTLNAERDPMGRI